MKPLPKVEMSGLVVMIILLVVAGIAAMIGLNILSDLKVDACANSGAYWNSTSSLCEQNSSAGGGYLNQSLEVNASIDAGSGISNIAEQMPNIGLVVAAVVIIGLLIGGFAFAFRGGGGINTV